MIQLCINFNILSHRALSYYILIIRPMAYPVKQCNSRSISLDMLRQICLHHAFVVGAGLNIVGREELVDGEAYAAEHRAGVILV